MFLDNLLDCSKSPAIHFFSWCISKVVPGPIWLKENMHHITDSCPKIRTPWDIAKTYFFSKWSRFLGWLKKGSVVKGLGIYIYKKIIKMINYGMYSWPAYVHCSQGTHWDKRRFSSSDCFALPKTDWVLDIARSVQQLLFHTPKQANTFTRLRWIKSHSEDCPFHRTSTNIHCISQVHPPYCKIFHPQLDPYLSVARNASRIFLRELNTQRYLVLCRNKQRRASASRMSKESQRSCQA